MKDSTPNACAVLTVMGLGCLAILAKSAIVIGAIYAAVHFISKHW